MLESASFCVVPREHLEFRSKEAKRQRERIREDESSKGWTVHDERVFKSESRRREFWKGIKGQKRVKRGKKLPWVYLIV